MDRLLLKYNNLPNAVKASVWFTFCSILQKGISFLTIPIFTRMLSVEEYGIILLFSAWQNILSIFATLNLSYQIFNNGMVKFPDDRDGYTTAMLGLSNLATIVLFIIYLIFHAPLEAILNLPGEAIIMMFAGFLFSAAASLWTVQQRYVFEYRSLCTVTLAGTAGAALMGVICVYLVRSGLSKIFADTIVAVVIGIGIYYYLLKKNRRLINFKYWKYALKLDLPLIPHYLSMIVLGSSDRIMINAFYGKAFTALYSVPYNASMVMQIVITSINASFIPWTYQKCREQDFRQLRRISSVLLVAVMLITLVPSLFAPELVWILGSNRYSDSMWVVPPVSCSVFFMFLYSLFSNIELYYEKSKNIMTASVGAAVGNVLLNFIFIPAFGYLAAAYTTLACYILLSIAHFIFMNEVCRDRKISEDVYDTKLIVIVSAILIVYSIGVTFLFDKPAWIRYLIVLLITGFAYFKKDILLKNLAIIKNDHKK